MGMEEGEETMEVFGIARRRRSEEEEEGGRRRSSTILVGVKMGSQSRDLLTWTIINLAAPGDRIIALHVLLSPTSSSSSAAAPAGSPISVLQEAFCDSKQIDLKLKICWGSSLVEVLVRESISCSALKLVLGSSSSSSNSSPRIIVGPSPSSTARYCAKKLQLDCSVIAVCDGKVVYERKAASSRAPDQGMLMAPSRQSWSKSSSFLTNRDFSRGWVRRTESMDSTIRKAGGLFLSPTPPPEESKVSSVTEPIRSSPPNGWQLLRRAFLRDRKKPSPVAPATKSRLAVLRWAMGRLSLDRKNSKTRSAAMADGGGGEEKLPNVLVELKEKYSLACRVFSYEELKEATSNFFPENLIGEGGSSRVFKGRLSGGKEVAVKSLKKMSKKMVTAEEFAMEIEIHAALSHKNIIPLLGFCSEGGNLLLVYDFLSKGTLEECLHGEGEGRGALNWSERFKIAVGVADALDYIHSSDRGEGEPIIHRDVKSSNILLSDDLEPMLCDFGLAVAASRSPAAVLNPGDVAGTFGYLAPEYFTYGKATEEVDIYAFGVVLLELLSGRRPIMNGGSKGQESLVMWATKTLREGKQQQLADPSLGKEYREDQMEKMVLAATLCIRRFTWRRPRMTTVLKLLHGDEEVLEWARVEAQAATATEMPDGEPVSPSSDIQSYINLALLDVDDDESTSSSSSSSSSSSRGSTVGANLSVEDYLQGRWSRPSSFN